MKLSILILTHNRPRLFQKCIASVLKNKPKDVEVLVNNDSNDIKEVGHNLNVKYFYKQSDNLGILYKYLFDEAQGEFIFFLEDDDYLWMDFYKKINFNYSINYLNFISYDIMKSLVTDKHKPFEVETENEHFQLSQILFKKELVTDFPTGNALDNDWKLFQHIKEKHSIIHLVKDFCWVQTTAGNDNISFPLINKDSRWTTQNN